MSALSEISYNIEDQAGNKLIVVDLEEAEEILQTLTRKVDKLTEQKFRLRDQIETLQSLTK